MKKMRKKFKAVIAIVLCLTCMLQPVTASAATFGGKTYIKETILSYGKTEAEAKSWLTNKGYKVLDYNLNEDADDTFSTKRAVYLGYKTTSDADEAITDMKVMNMNGGYSVEDYQLFLEQQKAEIRVFINNFLVAIREYRANYKNGQQRAVAAFELLNLMYDNDTECYLGDLFLNKVREEYTDKEYNALSKDEQSKVADLTTILMQANATAVLAMEQVIALATDDSDTTWIDRYQSAKSYDDMVSDLMDSEDLTASQAAKRLAAAYDLDAKAIASKFADYKDYLKTYTDAGLSESSTEEEIEAYKEAHDDFEVADWSVAAAQYQVLKVLENDGISLLDLILGEDDLDVQNEDRYLLYPLVASLTDGQRACLDFLPMYQIVTMGINGDEALQEARKQMKIGEDDNMYVSIYAGVDRSVFSDNVAMTGDAYKLQNSTGKSAMESWTGYISSATKILYCVVGVSMIATIASWVYKSHIFKVEKLEGFQRHLMEMSIEYETVANKSSEIGGAVNNALSQAAKDAESVVGRTTLVLEDAGKNAGEQVARSLSFVEDSGAAKSSLSKVLATAEDSVDDAVDVANINAFENGTPRSMAKVFQGIGIAMTCVTIVLMAVTLWNTYNDLKEYYNTEFTPIPSHMVNQGVNEKDEKVYTYYTAVKCNREEAQMVTDSTKLLEDYGDLNGDVGRQWVALYTTKDTAAGDPITANMLVQYEKSDVPEDRIALSMFGESVAQNLTNKKAGYTYADGKKGIYLFYGADSNAYAGSAVSNGIYALVAGCSMAVFAVAAYFVGKGVMKKKQQNGEKEESANA